jgi:hypothetical protein
MRKVRVAKLADESAFLSKTEEELRARGLGVLLEWSDCTERIHTALGRIPYLNYVRLEAARLTKQGRLVEVFTTESGLCALFANPVAKCK